MAERTLNARERELLVSTLELMRTGDHDPFSGTEAFDSEGNSIPNPKALPEDPEPYLSQVDSLSVIGECGCGQEVCETVYFVEDRGFGSSNSPKPVAIANTEDDKLAIVFARSGQLVELEVIA